MHLKRLTFLKLLVSLQSWGSHLQDLCICQRAGTKALQLVFTVLWRVQVCGT